MKLQSNCAFTIVELLTVVAIIAIVAAILFPVFSAVKESAKVTLSKSNLHQRSLETVIYQADNEGSGKYWDSFCMGLTPMPSFEKIPSQLSLLPPNSPSKVSPDVGKVYPAIFNDPEIDLPGMQWKDYAFEKSDGSVLYCDPFNNGAATPLDQGDYLQRTVYGVTLSGSIVRARKRGSWQFPQWWSTVK